MKLYGIKVLGRSGVGLRSALLQRKNRRLILSLLSVLLISSCYREKRGIPGTSYHYPIPVVIDTFLNKGNALQVEEMKVAITEQVLVGNVTDTLRLGQSENYTFSNYSSGLKVSDSLFMKSQFTILTDVKSLLTLDLEKFSSPPGPVLVSGEEFVEEDIVESARVYDEWAKRPRNYVQAIPVFIFNSTNDTAYLEIQDGRVHLIQEAKDENGVWKPIEYWRYSWCGASYRATIISKYNFAFIKVVKYSGDFETEIRIKFVNHGNTFYSNSFNGSIDKRQFILPSDSEVTSTGSLQN